MRISVPNCQRCIAVQDRPAVVYRLRREKLPPTSIVPLFDSGERKHPSEAETIRKCFPSSTARVWDMDFTQANVPLLLSNLITSLDIHHMSSRLPGVSPVLHGFLYESPSLLHLKVNRAFYSCENFVFGSSLNGVLSASDCPNELCRHDLPSGLTSAFEPVADLSPYTCNLTHGTSRPDSTHSRRMLCLVPGSRLSSTARCVESSTKNEPWS